MDTRCGFHPGEICSLCKDRECPYAPKTSFVPVTRSTDDEEEVITQELWREVLGGC